MTPEGAPAPTPKPRPDETLIKAHRWRRQIESGCAKSVTDLAGHEGVTDAYICRHFPLTCLAPDIVEAILNGRQPKGLRLAQMLGKRAAELGGGTSEMAIRPLDCVRSRSWRKTLLTLTLLSCAHGMPERDGQTPSESDRLRAPPRSNPRPRRVRAG
jgi:hypothetical protein